MTGYKSKRAAAQDKLKCQCSMTTKLVGSGCQYCNPEYMDDHSEDNLNMVAQPAQAKQCNYPDCKCPTENPCLKGLAQPAQEPVAWVDPATLYQLKIGLEGVHLVYETEMVNSLPLYDKPQRRWVGLTKEEILDLFDATNVYGSKWIEFARAVEAKLREKNT
jgi:hypothetical protein